MKADAALSDTEAAGSGPLSAPAAALVPEGDRYPAQVPVEIFERALQTFLAGKRLDMRALASDLGIGRATLYRRAVNKDYLLGEVIWYLARRALISAIDSAGDSSGSERVLLAVGSFMRFIHAQPSFHRLLDAEPEAALRILTSKEGQVQVRLIEVLERLLAEEDRSGALRPGIDRETLAYVIVRIGESFLYADVIADADPDIDQAVEVIGRLLDGS